MWRHARGRQRCRSSDSGLEPVVSEEPFEFTDAVDCVREDELRRDEVVNCGVL